MNQKQKKLLADQEAVTGLRRDLNGLARTRTSSNQKSPGLIEEILPALTALSCFLSDIRLSPAAALPFEYLLSAVKSAQVGNPHPLFKISNRKAASRDLEIDALREHIVHLVVVTTSPDKDVPTRYDAGIQEVYGVLRNEIESIKMHSRSRNRKTATPQKPWQAVRRWLEESIPTSEEIRQIGESVDRPLSRPESQRIASPLPKDKQRSGDDRRKARRAVLWLGTLEDRKAYRSLSLRRREKWFKDQVEFIREEFDAVLSAR
ncbi:hypothetical protein [Afipia clevelandensis]|uniref:Uncharacterized protein n=1 Tax=Afipia clevelandensis ATCC 49720 TaxID=883079 RepID=K8NQM0_9BRAD|nr:hypothetical protein [Afipia clevelandensis]EKS32672.1 hypothetical protein HMPREF9696_03649 [Afipia clevelandensis ATCC 49720]